MSLRIAQDAEYIGKDRWKWAVWIEGSAEELEPVYSVAWHLHPTFPKPLRWADDPSNNFRLEATGWGMFEIRATVYNESGEPAGPLRHMLQFERPDSSEAPMRGFVDVKPRRIFISASLGDAGVARQLRKGLEEQGYEVADSSVDPQPGEDWQLAIQNAISRSDAVVAVGSEGTQVSFIDDEVQLAEKADKRIIPVVVGEQALPKIMARYQALRVQNQREIGGIAGAVTNLLR